jgi:CysZ protein
MIALKDHYYALKHALSLILKGYFLIYFIPGLVIGILFYLYTSGLSTLNNTLGFFTNTPWIGNTIGTAIDTVFNWVNSISIFVYQFTIITLLSPFHTMLSQRIETLETGKVFDSNWSKFFNDILRTIGVVFLGGMIYFFIYLIWSLFAWLLGISFLSPFVSALLIGFFTGFNSYDYSLERHDVSVAKSWVYAFQHPLQMTLTGGIFTLLLYIPIIGVVIAPVLLTMVGTINYLRMEARKKLKNS